MSSPPSLRLPGNPDELDPRVWAVLTAEDPDAPQGSAPTAEAQEMLSAAVAELRDDLARRPSGIAPVLGAGVLASVLHAVRTGESAEPEEPAGSRIDTRR